MEEKLMSPPTPTESMLLQHEERIADLERHRPCHEALGNYQDVARSLLANIANLSEIMNSPHDFAVMYLLTFHKLPTMARIEQCWQVSSLCREKSWRALSRLIYYTVRMYGREMMTYFPLRDRPFLDEKDDHGEETTSFSLTSETLPLSAQMMQHIAALVPAAASQT